MSDNEIVPFSEIESSKVDLNSAVKQGKEMIATLKSMRIIEATFENGDQYRDDKTTKTTTIASDGILMQQGEHTTTVILRNEGSSKVEALEEISQKGPTQKIIGAFSDKSQQRVSQILLEDSAE